jgi:hypothetical protein
VRHWEYNAEVARVQICHLLARLDLPIFWVRLMLLRSTLRFLTTPKFVPVSRQTTTRDLVKYYADCRAKLVEALSYGVSSVALTSDIWSGNAKED